MSTPVFPLSEREAVTFLEHFNVLQTVCPIHYSVPFAEFTPSMWANVTQFIGIIEAGPGQRFAEDPFLGRLAPMSDMDDQAALADRYRMKFRRSDGEVVTFDFLFARFPGAAFINRLEISAGGECKTLAMGAPFWGAAARAFSFAVLGDTAEATAAFSEHGANYTCPANLWHAVVRPNAEKQCFEFALADGRRFGVLFDGTSFTNENGDPIDVGIDVAKHFGKKNPYAGAAGIDGNF